VTDNASVNNCLLPYIRQDKLKAKLEQEEIDRIDKKTELEIKRYEKEQEILALKDKKAKLEKKQEDEDTDVASDGYTGQKVKFGKGEDILSFLKKDVNANEASKEILTSIESILSGFGTIPLFELRTVI
jgi:DNA polymerase sigma